MKKETIAKRICKNFLTSKGELSARHTGVLIDLLTSKPGRRYRYFTWCRSGRLVSARNSGLRYYEVFDALGLDFICDNDAPRGGRDGDYFQLTKKGENQVKDIRAHLVSVGVNYLISVDHQRREKLARIFKALAGVA